MRARAVAAGVILVFLALMTGEARRAEPRALTVLLDAYLAGDYDAVLASIETEGNLEELQGWFERDGRAWTEAAGPAQVDRSGPRPQAPRPKPQARSRESFPRERCL